MIRCEMIYPSEDMEGLWAHTLGLPDHLRPKYFGTEEIKYSKRNQISDEKRFASFRAKNPQGYFLFGEYFLIHIISYGRNHSGLSLGIYEELSEAESARLAKDADEAIEVLSGDRGLFGFIAHDAEVEHRNRFVAKIEEAEISSWIGRDLDRYVPGLYWKTLLSDEILHQHDIDLNRLQNAALTHSLLPCGGQHVLTFFESPDEWTFHAGRIDQLCEDTEGIFSRNATDRTLQGIDSLLASLDALDEWP